MKYLLLAAAFLLASCGKPYERGYTLENLVSSESTAADVTSDALDVIAYEGFSVHVSWTGDTDGTVYLQASNDGSNWENITGASVATGGAAASELFNVQGVFFKSLRVFYDRTGGTGVLSAVVIAKGER